jgi:hypothetical protein
MSVVQGNLYSLLAMITPQIIDRLMAERGLGFEDAAAALYGSELYRGLEDEGTKLWRLSPLALTDLLGQELDTGVIEWPEEQ